MSKRYTAMDVTDRMYKLAEKLEIEPEIVVSGEEISYAYTKMLDFLIRVVDKLKEVK